MRYRRIEVWNGSDWIGPAFARGLPSPMRYELGAYWADTGVGVPFHRGIPIPDQCLFAWTEEGWAKVGDRSISMIVRWVGAKNVRVRYLQGKPHYKDRYQVAIPVNHGQA